MFFNSIPFDSGDPRDLFPITVQIVNQEDDSVLWEAELNMPEEGEGVVGVEIPREFTSRTDIKVKLVTADGQVFDTPAAPSQEEVAEQEILGRSNQSMN